MRTRSSKKAAARGSALVVAMFICTLMGIALASYLALLRWHSSSVARSEAWNGALTVAEAGVEEAMAQLNPGFGAIVDREANGWGAPADGSYGPKVRGLAGGTYSVLFTADPYPIIYALGNVTVPYSSASVSRVIRVTTTNEPLFGAAMVAKLNINMNGNSIVTDSFDSSNPGLSSNGLYSASSATTNGDVASLGGVVNVGNADIHGDLYLGPSATNSVNNNGLVTGTTYTDFNFEIPDIVLPTTTWTTATPLSMATNIGGVAYAYYFGSSQDYIVSSPGNIYVAPGAHVRIYVMKTYSAGVIRVAGSGIGAGDLQIYMGGTSFSLTSQSIVDGGNAANLGYWGLPGNTSITCSGNASFVGTIYAPEADFTLGGGGSGSYDFVGSVIVKSVTVNGHFSFHYDENLLRAGPMRGYVATSWHEI